jgi:hypothetical protein
MAPVVVIPVVAIEPKPIIVLVDSRHQPCSLLIKSKSPKLHISLHKFSFLHHYLMLLLNFMALFLKHY